MRTASQLLPKPSIIITGCSSGIGLASAREMKARGWRVFATARKQEDIARLRDEEEVESVYLDYAEPRSIEAAAAHVLAATQGELTALFNNGAYGQPGAVEDLTPEVLRAQFEANVFGWHDLTRRVIPAMRAKGEGRIVFCSSVLGLVAAPYRGAYCASKFAIEALADSLRMELAPAGIKIVLIEPGRSPRASSSTRSTPIAATSIWKPRRIARSIAPASLGSKRAAARPSSSGPRRWR